MTSLSPAFMAALDSEIIDKNPFFRIKVPDSQAFEETEKEALMQKSLAEGMNLFQKYFRDLWD